MSSPPRRHPPPSWLAAAATAALLVTGCAAGVDARYEFDPDAPAIAISEIPPTVTPPPVTPTPPTAVPTPSPTASATATPEPTTTPVPSRSSVVPLGTFDVTLAPEVSGVVASRREPDLLWLLDDGPGTTAVIGVRTSGEHVATVMMEGVEGRDTEGIAIGPCAADDPTPCLYVGDMGDNNAVRERILIHRFPEPTIDATSTPVRSASLTYPDGPVDAEGLLVGPDGLPIIITKEPDVARIMTVTAFADGELVEAGRLTIPPPASPLLTLFTGLTITGADSTPDGQRVLLRTYDHLIELTAPTPDSPLTTLASWPWEAVPVAFEAQGEAVAYLADGRSYVTASEGSGVLSAVRR